MGASSATTSSVVDATSATSSSAVDAPSARSGRRGSRGAPAAGAASRAPREASFRLTVGWSVDFFQDFFEELCQLPQPPRILRSRPAARSGLPAVAPGAAAAASGSSASAMRPRGGAAVATVASGRSRVTAQIRQVVRSAFMMVSGVWRGAGRSGDWSGGGVRWPASVVCQRKVVRGKTACLPQLAASRSRPSPCGNASIPFRAHSVPECGGRTGFCRVLLACFGIFWHVGGRRAPFLANGTVKKTTMRDVPPGGGIGKGMKNISFDQNLAKSGAISAATLRNCRKSAHFRQYDTCVC